MREPIRFLLLLVASCTFTCSGASTTGTDPCGGCPAGQLCNAADATCRDLCNKDRDCSGCGTCLEGLCYPAQSCSCTNHADCDDSDPCNGVELCVDKACQAGTPHVCPAAEACQEFTCVNDNGSARCDPIAIEEGEACAANDACGQGYVCQAGACEPTQLTTCTPGPCQVYVGCDPASGCQFVNAAPTTPCSDGNLCTTDDACNDAGQCVGSEVTCDDQIDCTEDSCNPGTGACDYLPRHDLCELACNDGTCDPAAGCQYEAWPNFTECGLSDFCYNGACAKRSSHTIPDTCTPVKARDIDAHDGTFYALVDRRCNDNPYATVYTVSVGAAGEVSLTGHQSRFNATGHALRDGFVVGATTTTPATPVLGVLDTSGSVARVDWSGTPWHTALDAVQVASGEIGPLMALSSHTESVALNSTLHVWMAGMAYNSNTYGYVARCSRSFTALGGWADAATCRREFSYGHPPRDIAAFASFSTCTGCLPIWRYSGAFLATYNPGVAGNPTRLYDDPERDYTLHNNTSEYDREANAVLKRRDNAALVLGKDGLIVYCQDTDQDGSFVCSPLNRTLPQQVETDYFDGVETPAGDLVILGRRAVQGDPHQLVRWRYVMVVLSSAADPRQVTAWREYSLGSYTLAGGSIASAVAASEESIMVLGFEDHGLMSNHEFRIWRFAAD